jgi:GntR family transcriptional regulator
MYMFSKKQRLVSDLTEQIRSGELPLGERLPGENRLAERYQVSRGTVRGALSELQQQDLIATRTGIGSFVTFDGVPLDQHVGWARALAAAGSRVSTELLAIEPTRDAALTARFGLTSFVEVRRLRRTDDGCPVSLERAVVPAIGALADLPETGLVGDSLTATLAAAGLRPVGGEQRIAVDHLDADSARLLDRRANTLFLRATRTSVDRDGALVEHVESLLDPMRFEFQLTFGGR